MALSSVPFALQNTAHSAEIFRQAVSSLLPNAGGIQQPGDFNVTQTGTPSMAVSVSVGRCWIPGTNVSNLSGQTYSKQGMYFGLNDAAVTKTIAASDPTNPRIDVVYLCVKDSFYSGATDSIDLYVVTGTPAATPVEPTVPANSIALATIAVAANATTIVNANITMKSLFYVGEGVAVSVTPNALYTSATGFRSVKVRRVRNRAVLNGAFTNVGTTTWTAGTNYTLGTLPSGYAPPANQAERFPITWATTSGSNPVPGWAGIDSTGNITFALSSTISGAAANLYIMSVSHTWDVI
ncbi:hypothetical protein SEA_MUFASA8_21 [Arthrobacter phage Mufasa8]|uniref:Uncharacterized protein n=1 Tax=Arthrobacter phage Mufasa8 TaxID=2656526 RepID=A0A649VM17_9CAUD|nr:virion structural protein [Arthrobacter phage Mufasa8]QGJ93470.1 hypothetical protein SEA_MUFASA8_21 [Arthrobacter phage Mufasa8]